MPEGLDITHKAVFDHSSTPFLVISEEGVISYLNSAAAELFKCTVKGLTGSVSSKVLKSVDGTIQAKKDGERFRAIGITGEDVEFKLSCVCSVLSQKEVGNVLLIEVEKNDTNLSMFESVVVNVRDAVMVTKSHPITAPEGPEIVYVNRAFTTMTGYSVDEVIGKTPRFLQSKNSESPGLEKLRNAIKENIPTDVELINRKKNGEEFWVQISLTPVFNDHGRCTHYIAIERDITERKNREILKKLQEETRELFNKKNSLKNTFEAVLQKIISYGNFPVAEMWLINEESSSIDLLSYGSRNQDLSAARFYEDSNPIMSFRKGEGMPGLVWNTAETQMWKELSRHEQFERKELAQSAGIEAAICIPVFYNKSVVGALFFGLEDSKNHGDYYLPFLEEFGRELGTEIKRKQSEIELSRIFSFSPDIICVAGMDGYFKKVNSAMSRLLGFTQDELLAHPISSFTHPDDRRKTEMEIDAINLNKGAQNFKNRLIAKDGSVVWLSWTTRTFFEEGKVYSVARDITEQKELESLLEQANRLAKIGGWEVDIINEKHYWSEVTREIHEVAPDYMPAMGEAIQFYKEGDSRNRIEEAVQKAIQQGVSFDLEVQIVTARGNEKWVRAIGEPEIVEGKCVRLYGSFQDIDEKKSMELRLRNISDNIPGVLFKYCVDSEGNDRLLYLSKGSSELWGVPAEAAMRDNSKIWDRFNEDDFETVQESIQKSAETLTRWESQWRYYHPDGSVRWQEGYGTPNKLSDGSVEWDSIIFDITEKKELEDLLEHTARLAKVGSWELNLQKSKNEMYWSGMTKEILGVDDSYNPTLTGGFEFYAPGDRRRIEDAVERAISHGESFDLELLISTSKNAEKWIRCIGQAEMVNGKCVRLYGSFQDIDVRKKAELKLQERSRHIDAIARLNSALLNYTEWKTALESNMEVIGEAVQADRVYYFENRFEPETGNGFTSQVFEWCRDGIKSELGNPDLNDVPFDELPDLINPMLEKKASSALISEIEEGGTIRHVMETQNIKSFLVIPVYVQEKFHGFIGFDNCTAEVKWSDEEVRTLTTITSNLAVAIERYEADKNLQEIFTERNRILESISDAFYAVDGNWVISYFNREAENLLHVQSDEAMGANLWDLFPAAKSSELSENYREVMNEGIPKSFEYYYPPLSSWFDISAYPAGNGISVYFKNINDRKETQARILGKTRQLDAIAKFNGNLINLDDWQEALQKSFEVIGRAVDADRVYFFQNSFSEELGEKTARILSEWEGKQMSNRGDHPAQKDTPFSKLEEFLKPLSVNSPYKRFVDDISDPGFRGLLKDQGIKSILAIPVFVGTEFYGAIGFDDCSQKRAWSSEEISFLQTISINLASAIENEESKEALQKAYNEKNEILESIGDAFFAVDKNWEVTYWNKIAERELQMPREEVIGKNLWDIYGDAVDLDFYSEYHKAMSEHCTVIFEEYYPALEKWFDVSAYPSSEGLSVFFKDITDRKHRMEELKELNRTLELQTKELAASNAELEQFAFVASHDLQEPLRMVTSFLSQLEKRYGDELDEKAKKYIWFASDGAKRMRQIILDLLDYSRTGQMEMKKEDVDLNLLMEAVVRDYGEPIDEKEATVKWTSLPVIEASGQSMNRLLGNLLSNALKYRARDRSPQIEVKAEDLGSQWKISVSDNGIGIEEEYREKIFNIFQRLHSKEEYTGTGIGLAICRKIVDAHGGRIWAESELNTGSTFHFTIKKPG